MFNKDEDEEEKASIEYQVKNIVLPDDSYYYK